MMPPINKDPPEVHIIYWLAYLFVPPWDQTLDNKIFWEPLHQWQFRLVYVCPLSRVHSKKLFSTKITFRCRNQLFLFSKVVNNSYYFMKLCSALRRSLESPLECAHEPIGVALIRSTWQPAPWETPQSEKRSRIESHRSPRCQTGIRIAFLWNIPIQWFKK